MTDPDTEMAREIVLNWKLSKSAWEADEDIIVFNGKPVGGTVCKGSFEFDRWWLCEEMLKEMAEPIAQALRSVRREENEKILDCLKNIPYSNNYKANRYDTDDEVVLHLWDVNSGESYDIRIKK